MGNLQEMLRITFHLLINLRVKEEKERSQKILMFTLMKKEILLRLKVEKEEQEDL